MSATVVENPGQASGGLMLHPCRILEQRKKEADGKDVDMTDVLDDFQRKARDHARVPIQVLGLAGYFENSWYLPGTATATTTTSGHAGFTSGTPWMRVNSDYKLWYVSSQISDPASLSVHNFWKEALRVRKTNDVLVKFSG